MGCADQNLTWRDQYHGRQSLAHPPNHFARNQHHIIRNEQHGRVARREIHRRTEQWIVHTRADPRRMRISVKEQRPAWSHVDRSGTNFQFCVHICNKLLDLKPDILIVNIIEHISTKIEQ